MIEIEIIPSPTKIIIDEENIDFKSLEEIILKYTMGQGKEIFQSVIKKLDDTIFTTQKRESVSEGTRAKYIQTIFGKMVYKRRLYKEEKKEGTSWKYYLDEKLGLEKYETTSDLYLYESIKKATEVSYRTATSDMKKICGYASSHETHRKYVKKIADKIKDKEPLPNTQKEDNPKDNVVYFEADDTGVAIRDKNNNNKRGSIKLGIFHKGIDTRYKKTDKYYEAKDKYYIGGIMDVEKFYDKARDVLDVGMFPQKDIIIGGDGAEWIKKGCEHFRGYFTNILYYLCRYHLNRNIKKALGYQKQIEKKAKEIILEYNLDKASKFLSDVLKTKKGEKDRKKIQELNTYLKNNWKGITSKTQIQEKYPNIRFGGIIEGNIDKVVANRFKKRGCAWSKDGASSLFTVKLSYLNGELNKRLGIKINQEKEEGQDDGINEYKTIQHYDGIKGEKEYFLQGDIPSLYIQPGKVWVKVLKSLTRQDEI